ncbi:MAG: YqeG family HAD IIIA-type phosphatase [Bacilli bacterium]|nr:YqeG family HAD IIIA-type phosphatase [Bacilli bacterium]
MEIYVPDMYKKSIYVIDYKKLKESGIKCLLFDLDNTLVPYSVKKPTKKVKDLFKSLQEQGFKVIIFSNSGKKRLQPFKEELAVDVCPRAFKPSTKKFISIMKELKYNESEVAIIGDQMLTDIIGGNKVGITTILTHPITKKDMIFTYINRYREKKIIKKLSKAGLFYKGKYYD